MGDYGVGDLRIFRNAGRQKKNEQRSSVVARKRKGDEAAEELREHGKLKRPWYH